MVIIRDRALAGAFDPYRVMLDGRRVGRIWFGGTLRVTCGAGVHQVRFLSGSVVLCTAVVHAGRTYELTHRRPLLRRLPFDILCGIAPRLTEV